MKIGIDIDNVIANTFHDLAVEFNRFMGKEYDPQEVVRVMRQDKWKMYGYWYKTWKDKLLSKVSPIVGAAEALKKWHPEHELVLVTSRLGLFNGQTKEWLAKHGIPYHELHHAKELTKHKKAPGCHVFLEDNIDECEVLADHCERVYLFDQPWNQRELKKNNIKRVKGWEDLENHIG